MPTIAFEHVTRIRHEKYWLNEDGDLAGINPLATDLKDSIDHLAQGLYTRNAHFIFELIQNAEDNSYSSKVEPALTFKLLKNDPTNTPGADGALVVENNEVGFSKENFEAICAIGKSTKKSHHGFIGEKGIGFKSIFRVTSRPFLFSNGYQVSLPEWHAKTGLGYIVPEWVEVIPNCITPSLTSIVLPLDKPGFGYDGVKKMLRSIEPETIIFLSKLKEIKIVSDSGEGFTIIKDDSSEPNIQLLTNKNGNDEVFEFLLFRRSFDRPEEINHEKRKNVKQREVAIAFPFGGKASSAGKLFAYLPVRCDTGFPFIINADFILPSSREDIQDTPWNRDWLMPCAGELVSRSLPLLKEKKQISIPFLESLAKSVLALHEDDMYFSIARAIKEAFTTLELLPADDGSYISAENAKLARGADLRKLLSHDQLRLLFRSAGAIKWLAGEITQDRSPDLRSYLISELEVEEVTPDGFGRKISHPFLVEQSDEWFYDFYGYLSGQEALWRAPRWERDSGGMLRSKPILRLDNGSQAVPFGPDGTTPKAYLPPPEETLFPVVKRSIANDEQSQTFLKRLGLSEPDVFDDIVERVLPKYTKIGGSPIPDQEHEVDIHKIVRAMCSDSETGKRKVMQAARQTPFLRAFNPSEGVSFKKPCEIYHNSTDLRRYFSHSKTIWFLHDGYYSEDLCVWNDLGVAILPRKIPVTTDVAYEKREWQGHSHSVEDFELDGLQQLLKGISRQPDFEERCRDAFVLWDILNDHLVADSRFFKAKYSWHHYRWKAKFIDSGVLSCLQSVIWVPTKKGTLKKPIEVTTDQLLDSFLGASELIESLGIAEGSDQREEARKRKHATELGVSLEDIEFLKNHRDEVKKLKDDLAAGKKRPVFPSSPVVNPDRRKEHLDEQKSDAPKKGYEKRERSVRTTNGAIDPITWLRNRYTNEADQMVCQICKEEMPFRKRNGKHYFEKKELLSRNYLPKEHEAQYLALCPLCAAKYEEFIKSDEDVMAKLKEAIVSNDNCEVPISLGDQQANIRFVEAHYHDLKHFVRDSNGEKGCGWRESPASEEA